jgi:hypothetical protein
MTGMTHETRPSCVPYALIRLTGLSQPVIEAMLRKYVDCGSVDFNDDAIAADTRAIRSVLHDAGFQTVALDIPGCTAADYIKFGVPFVALQFGTADAYGHVAIFSPVSGLLHDTDNPEGYQTEGHPCDRLIFARI